MKASSLNQVSEYQKSLMGGGQSLDVQTQAFLNFRSGA